MKLTSKTMIDGLVINVYGLSRPDLKKELWGEISSIINDNSKEMLIITRNF